MIIHIQLSRPLRKKWVQTQEALGWVWEFFGIPSGMRDLILHIKAIKSWNCMLDTAEFCRIAGFLVHVTETYTKGRCFLKDFFNALEAFRPGMDLEG